LKKGRIVFRRQKEGNFKRKMKKRLLLIAGFFSFYGLNLNFKEDVVQGRALATNRGNNFLVIVNFLIFFRRGFYNKEGKNKELLFITEKVCNICFNTWRNVFL
jgi:hypothetical protein